MRRRKPLAEQIESTILQDYSEYQLSFQQEQQKHNNRKLQETTLERDANSANVKHFSARQKREAMTRSPDALPLRPRSNKPNHGSSSGNHQRRRSSVSQENNTELRVAKRQTGRHGSTASAGSRGGGNGNRIKRDSVSMVEQHLL